MRERTTQSILASGGLHGRTVPPSQDIGMLESIVTGILFHLDSEERTYLLIAEANPGDINLSKQEHWNDRISPKLAFFLWLRGAKERTVSLKDPSPTGAPVPPLFLALLLFDSGNRYREMGVLGP